MRLKHFFTITAIIVVCGCGVNEKDIMRYGREGNVDLLVRTIDKGYQKQKRHAKVKLAIEQIAKLDHQALNMINRAGQEWSAASPAQRRQMMISDIAGSSVGEVQARLRDMADNEAKELAKAEPEARLEMILKKATGLTKEELAEMENGGAIIATVLEMGMGMAKLNIDEMSFKETFKENEAWNYLLYRFESGFSEELIRHTLLAPSSTSNLNALQKKFLEHIKESDYTSAQALMSIAAGVGIADEQIPHTIQEQLQVTINAKTRLDSLNELQDFAIRSISDCQDHTEKAHKIQEKYFQLGGYILTQEDISNSMLFGVIGLYQIILNSGSGAYLQTTETRFDSKGQFIPLWVYEWGERAMTRLEPGGFTKTEQWKVYREATSGQVREMHEAMDIISASEELIEFSKGVIDSLEPLLSSQNETFHAAQSRLTRLLEETFGYSNVRVD